jgi:hypothetical protein
MMSKYNMAQFISACADELATGLLPLEDHDRLNKELWNLATLLGFKGEVWELVQEDLVNPLKIEMAREK